MHIIKNTTNNSVKNIKFEFNFPLTNKFFNPDLRWISQSNFFPVILILSGRHWKIYPKKFLTETEKKNYKAHENKELLLPAMKNRQLPRRCFQGMIKLRSRYRPRGQRSVICFIFLNFHHNMMNIGQLCPSVCRQNFVQSVIILNELCHRALHESSAKYQIRKRPQNFAVYFFKWAFPIIRKRLNKIESSTFVTFQVFQQTFLDHRLRFLNQLNYTTEMWTQNFLHVFRRSGVELLAKTFRLFGIFSRPFLRKIQNS